MASKTLKFYHTGIVNQWQKWKDVQGSCFDWLKHHFNSLFLLKKKKKEKGDSKIEHYMGTSDGVTFSKLE